MNNVKKSVLACLTLALCSLNSVEAISSSKDVNPAASVSDPIEGSWNFDADVTLAESLLGQAMLDFAGTANFHAGNTVEVFATELPVPPAPSDGPYLSASNNNAFRVATGFWAPTADDPNVYDVTLSTVVGPTSGVRAAAGNFDRGMRVNIQLIFDTTVTPCEVSATFSGCGFFTFLRPLDDLCFCLLGIGTPAFTFTGRACQLSNRTIINACPVTNS